MFKKLLVSSSLLFLIVLVASCSSESSSQPTVPTVIQERTTGFKAPDGTFVGPRGASNEQGVPTSIGAYGKRKTHKGNLTIKKNNETIENIDVEGIIYVNADNVKLLNFTAQQVTQKPGKTGMVIEDATIDGKNKNGDGIQWSDFIVRRTEITGSFDGIKAQGNAIIEDSYIHDLYAFRGKDAGEGGYTHNDCIQISVGKNILIQRNWFDNCGLNSAIFIDPDQGPIDNVTVTHNYLNGGGITLYAIASRSAQNGVPTNVNIENNVFGDTHEFDFATTAKGINFKNNIRTNGEMIIPRIDEDNT